MTELQSASIERDVVIAEGPETASFLHGQLSQDIAGLPVGDSVWSLLLEPQGKVVALLRVTRSSDERFLLDVDPGWGEAVVTRLTRFKLRTKCELTLESWPGIAWRGVGAAEVTADAPIVAPAGWSGIDGIDVVGPGVTGETSIDADQFETLRIAARWPAMGAELDGSTIPAATGIVDQTVSFTKGCYTGQELVARIDSRGSNTPTRLVRVTADSSERLRAGDRLTSGGDPVGMVTSASTTEPIALAYVKRVVEVPGSAVVDRSDQQVAVELVP
jgi:folate-binding protein YgfZ